MSSEINKPLITPGTPASSPTETTTNRKSPDSIAKLPGTENTIEKSTSLFQNASGYTRIDSDEDLSLLNKVVTNRATSNPSIKKTEGLTESLRSRMHFLPSVKQEPDKSDIQKKLLDPKN